MEVWLAYRPHNIQQFLYTLYLIEYFGSLTPNRLVTQPIDWVKSIID